MPLYIYIYIHTISESGPILETLPNQGRNKYGPTLGGPMNQPPKACRGTHKAASHVIPGPPKEPKIMDQYPKIEGIGSIGSIIWAILEVQVDGSTRAPAMNPNTDS